MNNYKALFKGIIFSAFIFLAISNEGFGMEMGFTVVQDTIPKQRPRSAPNESKTKKQTKADRRRTGVIKSVPRARRQARPNLVRPKIDAIKTVRPKIKAIVRLKV